MDRLGRYLGGPHLFIKRDDCTGLATGGSSSRKLEFLMADAIAAGADIIITQGPIQSNHARQTAAIASKLNMQCALALEDTADSDDRLYLGSANMLLDRLYGADVYRFPGGFDMEAAARDLAKRYEALGRRPYVIPSAAANSIGALGYVNCAFEIVNQLREQGLRIDRLVHATGSGGTQAGLVVGFNLTEIKVPVLGISVRTSKSAEEQKVYGLVRQTAERLGLEQAPPKSDVAVNDAYVGDAHDPLAAVTTVARCESILLDPIYTGRAMEGLIDLIVNKRQFMRDENILFLHTGGSVGLFGCVARVDRFLTEESYRASRGAEASVNGR
jgi:L-cysteate sulfo-lyase